MPLYNYRCDCGKSFTRMLKLADYLQPQQHCETLPPATKLISAPRIVTDYAGYECPVSGKWVEGRAAHRENLARTECRIFEPGEKQEYQRKLRQEDEKLDASLDETADRFIAGLSTDKRDSLAAEMEHGVNVEVTRN